MLIFQGVLFCCFRRAFGVVFLGGGNHINLSTLFGVVRRFVEVLGRSNFRMFAFIGTCGYCVLSLIYSPPKSSYWIRYLAERRAMDVFRERFCWDVGDYCRTRYAPVI